MSSAHLYGLHTYITYQNIWHCLRTNIYSFSHMSSAFMWVTSHTIYFSMLNYRNNFCICDIVQYCIIQVVHSNNNHLIFLLTFQYYMVYFYQFFPMLCFIFYLFYVIISFIYIFHSLFLCLCYLSTYVYIFHSFCYNFKI